MGSCWGGYQRESAVVSINDGFARCRTVACIDLVNQVLLRYWLDTTKEVGSARFRVNDRPRSVFNYM